MGENEREIYQYYDVSEGRLLTGQASYNQAIESGANPVDLIELRDILIEPEKYELPKAVPLEASYWDESSAVALTSWMGKRVIKDTVRLVDDHFRTLYKLGLGPSNKKISSLGGFSKLYEKAELTNAYKRGIYDEWDIDDFADYVGRVASNTPKTESLKNKLIDMSRAGEGPSYKVIIRRVPGGLGSLLARRGYYDFQRRDEEGYIEWGVDYKFSNNGRAIDTGALGLLSPKRRSPSSSAVIRRFGCVANLDQLVEDRYYEEQDRIETYERKMFRQIMEGLGSGLYPTNLFMECETEAEMRHMAARYSLMSKLCDSIRPEPMVQLARKSTKSVIKEIIKRSDNTLSIADIEVTACTLDIFDDVWPVERAKNQLKI